MSGDPGVPVRQDETLCGTAASDPFLSIAIEFAMSETRRSFIRWV